MPQYSRKQYSLKKYGRYQSAGGKEYYLTDGFFRRARIRLKLSDGHTVWIYQHRPVQFKGNYDKIRVKSNTGDTVYVQTVQVKGQHAVRVRSNLQTEDSYVSSQVIQRKNGGNE